jgi:hypothetical protein
VAFMILGCGLPMAGCSGTGQPFMADAGLSNASLRGTTVAFESIDGPPETVFRRLVLQLTQEAGTRQVAVVSREQPAQYRIRGYMAAHVQGKRTTISWVWDIYDAERERALRLSGDVPAGAADRNAWNAADDQVIGRIARDGMGRLAAFLANPNVAPPDQPSGPYEQPPPGVAMAPTGTDALAYLPSAGTP